MPYDEANREMFKAYAERYAPDGEIRFWRQIQKQRSRAWERCS